MTWLIGKGLSPFAAMLMIAFIRPWTRRLERRMRDSRLKRDLFFTWH